MTQLSLGKIKARLSEECPGKPVRHGFAFPHSYRGYYDNVAFELAENTTVESMLFQIETALSCFFGGWKGGEYKYKEDTPCWIAEIGCTGEPFTEEMLEKMLIMDKPQK